jgi:N-acetylmuramoyl-L-alanine amidase
MAARMLRDTDANLTLQHRAELSNQQRSSVYVALHAGVPGKGVRVYSSLLASRQQPAGRFIAWENAQSASLDRSSALAKAVTREVQKRELKALNLAAFLRPLNNIVSPAIAVELTADYSDEHSLESQKLQTTVASAVASAIAQMRAHLGGRP